MDYRNWRKSSGWLYLVLHPLAYVAYQLLFKKIYLHNRQGVKADTPVIIAANHPTAFVDPILFCLFFDPPVYNMTRGDIFRNPFFRKILESVNMFPVFRRRDGFDGRDRNDEVFEYCQHKLKEGVAVNIFVEGEHHLDKQVLPAQKGIARIAFGTYERHQLDELQIVPVGCNYISGERPRDEVTVIVGQPIFVKDYWDSYRQNPANAIAQLCRDIECALREQCCYHIEDRRNYALAEHLLEIWRNDNPARHLPVIEHNAERFFGEKKLLNRLNTLSEKERCELSQQTGAYFSALRKAKLTDEALVRPDQSSLLWLLFLVLAAPLALAGYLVGWPVRAFCRWITHKTVKKAEFRTSVLSGVAIVTGPVYAALLYLCGWLTDRGWLMAAALLLPISVWLSMYWHETLLRWSASRRAWLHVSRKELLEMRKGIAVVS